MAIRIYGDNQTAGVAITTTGKGNITSDGLQAYAQAVALFDAATGAPAPVGTSSSPSYVTSPAAVPLGYQQISAATLAASTSLTVPTGATYAIIQCSGGVVRWRDFGGTDPTALIGMRILTDAELFYDGDLATIEFILSSGTPVLDINYYRVP